METLAENRTLEICFKTQVYCFVVVVVLISDNNMESCRGYCYCFGVCTFKFLNYLNVVFLPSVSECECVCVCVCCAHSCLTYGSQLIEIFFPRKGAVCSGQVEFESQNIWFEFSSTT